MGGKVKEFQKIIQDDADFKDTVAGDHVSECPLSSCTARVPDGMAPRVFAAPHARRL